MIYGKQLKKEVCGYCSKFVSLGQAISECASCNEIIHTKCYGKAEFVIISSRIYCKNCIDQGNHKYNPFISQFDDLECADDDNFYNVDLKQIIDTIQNASNILETCNSYSSSELNSLLHNESNKFSTFFLNVDGNKSNFDYLTAELSSFNDKFSVIGLVETNAAPVHSTLYPITNYKSFYQNTYPNKNKGTGVALYVHESLNARINHSVSCVSENLECLFLDITLTHNVVITVGVLYRPPSGSNNIFLEEFESILCKLPNHPTYIMGDFNLDLFSNNLNIVNNYEDIFLASGFYPLISIATHEKPHCRKTCIDNILTNNIDQVTHTGTLTNKLAHHSPIFSISNIEVSIDSKNHDIPTQYYDFSKANISKFVDKLTTDTTELYNIPSLEFSEFSSIFHDALDATCKLDKPKTSKRTPNYNPWITDDIISSIKTKQKLYTDWKKTCNKKTPKGDRKLHTKYSDYRRNLKKIIKNTKSKFYCNKIDSCQGDMKKTWRIINQIRGKSKKSIKPQFIINNEHIVERRIIANKFNDYFASIATKMNESANLDDGIPVQNLPNITEFMPQTCLNSMYLTDCTNDEIMSIIHELDNNKSSDIPISIIKKSAHITSPLLTIIFNNHMQRGTFPDELKIGKISPIYKKDDEQHIENYRPVSTLPIYGKIFEKTIYIRFYSYFVSQNILHDKQFGFRKGHSTSHALNYSINYIHNSTTKENQHVLGLFIDLSKAFDTIDHKTLLTKLELYGVRGNAHSLIESYLSNRYQYVSVFNEKSSKLLVKYGVPQGSCLGPLLFLIYINDISKAMGYDLSVLFADDTNIFVKASTKKLVYEKANAILKTISRYMLANKLHINMSKCVYMHFSPKTSRTSEYDDTEYTLTLHNTPIPKVTQTKFLGVIIDHKLTWEPHI